jgi:4-hydroxyacetophenone monooxygenase
LLLKEMGLARTVPGGRLVDGHDFRVIIIGAGLSGIAMAIRLKRMGIPFVVYEKNGSVGGTWLVNTYPGCGVDIASHFFSYSFDRNPDWDHYYSKQPEVLSYLQRCVAKHGLEPYLHLGTEVTSAVFDESSSMWIVRTSGPSGTVNEVSAHVVVTAVGQLSVPKTPKFPGLENFEGATFHSANWNHSVDIVGKRVVLIGGGASANQIGPAIAPVVGSLTIMQRSPHWMMGVPRYHASVPGEEKWVLAHVPAYARWFRARTLLAMNDVMRPAVLIDPEWDGPEGTINAVSETIRAQLITYISEELGDRGDLMELVVPHYPPFLKRMLRDNGWYRMLRRNNVNLFASGVRQFVSDGVIDEQGTKHVADVVVFATGFQAANMLTSATFVGRNGRSIREAWGDDDPRAYLGISVPEFPNLFVLYGPNTNIGTGGSIFFQAECQTDYISKLITSMVERGLKSVEVKREVFEHYNMRLDARLSEMVWTLPSGDTWYRNKHGRVTSNMPWTSFEYWQLTGVPDLDHYAVALREEQDLMTYSWSQATPLLAEEL